MKQHAMPLAVAGLALVAACTDRGEPTAQTRERAAETAYSPTTAGDAPGREAARAPDNGDVGLDAEVAVDDGAALPDEGDTARAAEVSAGPLHAELVRHAEEGVALARIGEEKATDPGVKRIAAEMGATARQELALRQQDAGQGAPTSTPASTSSPAVSALQGLSGAAFDRQWVSAVIAHHEAGKALGEAKKDAKEARGDEQPKKQTHEQREQLKQQSEKQLEQLKELQKKLG